MYWGKAFQLLPNLHFDLIDTYVSPDSVVVFYQNERGAQICEYLRLDAEGQDQAGFGQSSRALTTAVIASEAKQSISPHEERVDCFVAALPCANASRLSQAMTRKAVATRKELQGGQSASVPTISR